MNEQGPILFRVEHIGKRFPGVRALHDVSFSLAAGHVLGLVGQNGAGKSTLMNVLGGLVEPDTGAMYLDGLPYRPTRAADATQAGIAFIHQELNLFPNLSIADNLFIDRYPRLGPFIDRGQVRRRTTDLLALVDLRLDPATRVEQLSPGERQLVEIARALSLEARLIIFDEPTTSLTPREAGRLFSLIARLKGQGTGIIYISHTLGDVLRLADDIIVLREGEVVGSGPRDTFDVARMVSLMVGRPLDQLFPERESRPSDTVVLQADHLTQPGTLHDVSFRLHRGEVLGLFGLMGSGRTELARILFGLDETAGVILIDGKPVRRPSPRSAITRGLSFVTENRRDEGLLLEATTCENIGLVALSAYRKGWTRLLDHRRLREDASVMADRLRLRSADLEQQPVKHLSGGNQQKVVLAKWLLANPNVLILDEPTRGIDVGARYEIYALIDELAGQGKGIFVISSEIEELTGICDRILVMARGELQGSFRRSEFNRDRLLRAAFQEQEPA